jgi:hypothetical protein
MRKENYPIVSTSKFRELDFYNEVSMGFKDSWEFIKIYRIHDGDLGRPDRIMSKALPEEPQAHEYWWVLLIANDIQDPFNDMKVGNELKIPSIISIKQFIEFAKREKKEYGNSVKANISKGWMVI